MPQSRSTPHTEFVPSVETAGEKGRTSGKTSKATKMLLSHRLQTWLARAIKGPSLSHSILFGATGALVTYGGYFVYRGVKLCFFDTATPALHSRLRYAEKQELYLRELDEQLAAGHIASLAAEYDPVATRLPFQPLEDKYRF